MQDLVPALRYMRSWGVSVLGEFNDMLYLFWQHKLL